MERINQAAERSREMTIGKGPDVSCPIRVHYELKDYRLGKRYFQLYADRLVKARPGSYDCYVWDEWNTQVVKLLLMWMHGDPKFDAAVLPGGAKGDLRKGVALMGPTGTGKSLLMEVLNVYRNKDNMVYFQKGRRKFLEFKIRKASQIVNEYGLNGQRAIGEYSTMNCLAVDDLGWEQCEVVDYGNRINLLQVVMDERHRRGLMTHVTSNATFRVLAERYGDYIESRLHEMCNVFVLKGKDKRKG